MTRSHFHFCFSLFLAILAVGSVSAQDDKDVQTGIVLKDGTLRGRVSSKTPAGAVIPVDRLEMKLIRKGQIVETARTTASGEFEFNGLGPGNYSLTGAGKNGFLAIGVNVLDEQNADADQVEFAIDALAIPPRYTTLGRIMSRQLVMKKPRRLGFGEASLTRGLLASANTKVMRKGIGPIRFANIQTAANSRDEVILLDPDGGLRGRVFAPEGVTVNFSTLTAFIIQQDRLIDETPLNERGAFEFAKFEPGVYGFVIAGPDGLAAVQGEVKTRPDVQVRKDRARSTIRLAAFQPGEEIPEPGGSGFALSLLGREDLQAFIDSLPRDFRDQLGVPLGFPMGVGLPGPGLPGPAPGLATSSGIGPAIGSGALWARALGWGGLSTGVVALARDRTSPN